MNLWKSIWGQLILKLTSADVTGSLTAFNESGIPIHKAEFLDELTILLTVSRKDFPLIRSLTDRRGEKLQVVSRKGLFWAIEAGVKRPVLVFGILIMLMAAVLLPSRILFVRVEGSESVPVRKILAAAEDCGIRFGASRREIRSEKVKNALLSSIPQLQWIGINTSGCTATISVREKGGEESAKDTEEISSIAAAMDGIILSCTATAGNTQCVPGQAVREGQILISAYTDCGLLIKAEKAEGEIYAQTRRSVSAVTLQEGAKRSEEIKKTRSFSLVIGKNRINLWKDSRICDTTCGRMYEEYYITLPGGFVLPAALAVQTHICYRTEPFEKSHERLENDLSAFARNCILQRMLSGVILKEDVVLRNQDGIAVLDADYLCREMIGRRVQEGIGVTNGKSG